MPKYVATKKDIILPDVPSNISDINVLRKYLSDLRQSFYDFVNSFTEIYIRYGTSSPNGVVVGNIGDLYLKTNGGLGTVLYIKESGTGNTGWAGRCSSCSPPE